MIAAGIADAQLSILSGGGHLVNLEQPDVFNGELIIPFYAQAYGIIRKYFTKNNHRLEMTGDAHSVLKKIYTKGNFVDHPSGHMNILAYVLPKHQPGI